MKTQFFLTLSFLFLQGLLSAQNFAPLNAVWYFQDYAFNNDAFYIKVAVERDTAIEGKQVSILELYNNSTYIPEGRLYLHENDNQVFFFEDNEFKLLYDFNLEAGDTMWINIPKNRIHYDFACGAPDEDLINYKAPNIIDSVTYINLQGEELKVLHTTPNYLDETNDCFTFNTITERIGGEYGLCGITCTQCLGGFPGFIRCYADELINFHPYSLECDFISSTAELRIAPPKFYPNPVIDALYLESKTLVEKYKIFDLSGKIVANGELTEQVISMNHLMPGMYFLELQLRDGETVFSQKIIKQ